MTVNGNEKSMNKMRKWIATENSIFHQILKNNKQQCKKYFQFIDSNKKLSTLISKEHYLGLSEKIKC